MKKSEFKKYVRENIISELSENTEDEIAKTKELTSAIKDLESAKKEAGIEENEDNWADYTDIGQSYLEGFGKEHTLDDNQLEKLGKTIVKRLYKGDIGKAYDAIVKRDLKEVENVGLADLEEMGYNAADDFFETKVKQHLNSPIDFRSYQKGLMQGLSDVANSYGLNENEDAEPTAAQLKKEPLSKIGYKLADTQKEMKQVVKKWSASEEGPAKDKLKDRLKELNKIKKELESLLESKK
tara:strand:+ start:31 stop:747 length:717 start_codon:yes stop_codon:yes gene_type:complete